MEAGTEHCSPEVGARLACVKSNKVAGAAGVGGGGGWWARGQRVSGTYNARRELTLTGGETEGQRSNQSQVTRPH